MTLNYTILSSIQDLEETQSHEDKLYKILEIYMNLFPVKNSFLFRYSHFGFIGEGIISINPNGLVHIRDIRDDIRSLPIIYSALYERKAKYCSGIEYLRQVNSKYITSSNVNSFLVVPICFGSVSIGYICTNEFKNDAIINEHTLTSFTQFGRQVGRIMEKTNGPENTQLLSRRELEVMKRISWGESTKEMADTMDLSEVTINQYVKSAIKKLGVQNRVQAVAELFRKGILS
ncbi:response regulator transcription factor [Bacillus sp. USDA818B3_A]|uniref:response regulator transcription factor n=1 Tax=Bacillus sp. USDA818B3_A TaxID=2698834 RepID=UPI00136FA730|nr:helix-turn-helix transcriptional regulator [Bacillus sp. USDA818B3_A]